MVYYRRIFKVNNYDSLNTLIDTIEKNLKNEIDYQELAKVIGTSSYAMQRIFTFLTRHDSNRIHQKEEIKQSGRRAKKDRPQNY